MNRVRGYYATLMVIIVLCFFVMSSNSVVAGDDDGGQNGHKEQGFMKTSSPLSQIFSFSALTSSAATVTFWDRTKNLINRVQAYFFPPNLDFRGSDEGRDKKEGGGAGERVKEAVTESLQKTKAAVEDTAKSASELASETVRQTKEKVKRSLSDHRPGESHLNEL